MPLLIGSILLLGGVPGGCRGWPGRALRSRRRVLRAGAFTGSKPPRLRFLDAGVPAATVYRCDGIDSAGLAVPLLAMFLGALSIGLPLLMVALWRSRSVPAWGDPAGLRLHAGRLSPVLRWHSRRTGSPSSPSSGWRWRSCSTGEPPLLGSSDACGAHTEVVPESPGLPGPDRQDRNRCAATLAVAAAVAVLTAVRLALADRASFAELVNENEATNAVLGVTFAVLGALAVADRPRKRCPGSSSPRASSTHWPFLGARWVSYRRAHRPAGIEIVDLAAWVAAFAWIAGLLLVVDRPAVHLSHWRLAVASLATLGWAAVFFTVLASLVAFTSQRADGGLSGPQQPVGSVSLERQLAALFGPTHRAGARVRRSLGWSAWCCGSAPANSTTRAQVGWLSLFLALLFNVAVALLAGRAARADRSGFARRRPRAGRPPSTACTTWSGCSTAPPSTGALTTAIVGGVRPVRLAASGAGAARVWLGAVLAAVVVALGVGPAREWLQRVGRPIDLRPTAQTRTVHWPSIGRQLEDARRTQHPRHGRRRRSRRRCGSRSWRSPSPGSRQPAVG